MHRAHRAVVALAHGQQHRKCLGTANLADDHAVWIHAQRHASEIGKSNFALTFDIGGSRLQSVMIRVQMLEVVETQFVCIFDRDQAFAGWNFIN